MTKCTNVKCMTFQEAVEIMTTQTNSQLVRSVSEKHIKLPPKYLSNLKIGLNEQLNLIMWLFDTQLKGVPIAYTGIKLLQRLGRVISDQSCVHLDVVAEFIIFQPQIGCTLEGVINKVGKYHLSCLVHDCFNAWLPLSGVLMAWEKKRTYLMGQIATFTVTDIFTNNDILSMKGLAIKTVPADAVQIKWIESPENPMRKTYFPDEDVDISQVRPCPSATALYPEIESESDLQPLFSSTQVGDTSAMQDDDSMTKIKTKPKKDKHRKKHASDKSFEMYEKQTLEKIPKHTDESSGSSKHKKNKHRKKHAHDEIAKHIDESCDSRKGLGNTLDSSFMPSNSSRSSDVGSWQRVKKKKKREKHKDFSKSFDDDNGVSLDVTGEFTVDETDMDVSSERKSHKNKRKGEKHDKSVDVAVTGNGDNIDAKDISETAEDLSSHKKSKKKHKHSKSNVSTVEENLLGSETATESRYTKDNDNFSMPTPSKKKKRKSKHSESETAGPDHNGSDIFTGVDHQSSFRKHKLYDHTDEFDSGISSPKRRMWSLSTEDNNSSDISGGGSGKKKKKKSRGLDE